WGGEVVALRAAATVKSQLRRALATRAIRLGPAWLAGQQTGEIAALATRGLDGLDVYFARYLPQLVLAVVVPVAVLARVAAADWTPPWLPRWSRWRWACGCCTATWATRPRCSCCC